MLKISLVVILSLLSFHAWAARLTERQQVILSLAHKIGLPYDLGKTMPAIAMQESHAGELSDVGDIDAPVGRRSYGVMQVKVSAARDVLKDHPELGSYPIDEVLIAKLMRDDTFNITIATLHLKSLLDRGLTWRHALAAYNAGYTGYTRLKDPDHFHYVVGVVRYMKELSVK